MSKTRKRTWNEEDRKRHVLWVGKEMERIVAETEGRVSPHKSAVAKPGKGAQSDKPMKHHASKYLALLSVVGLLAFSGCTSTNPNVRPMTHAAFTAAVTLGEQFALEAKPEAVPYARAATAVVCSVANGTNVSPAAIVAALNAANVTNATAKMIINSSLAIYNVVIMAYPVSTNQSEIREYAKDLCNGLTAGLPPTNAGLEAKHKAALSSPHMLP